MPHIELEHSDVRKKDEIVKFVSCFMRDLSVNGRFALAVDLLRLFKPEIDELKRRKEVVDGE